MKNIKKQIITAAVAVFTGTVSFTQTHVTLTTQGQVDAFSSTEITGILLFKEEQVLPT